MEQTLPRGIRNNNPLNLRKSSNPWLGKIPDGSDKAFEQFTSIIYGIRAAFVNARTIIKRNPGCTVSRLILIWAPPSDGNDTAAYCNRVCKLSGLARDAVLVFKNRKMMCDLIWAMSIVENGREVDYEKFTRAYDML